MTAPHLPADTRRELILEAAMRVAEKVGYNRVTREQIALAAGVAKATVSLRLGTMEKTRQTLMKRAVAVGHAAVVAQGLALRDKYALKASEELKKRAAAHMSR
jgi:AcrR family transcriptional regulator